MKIALRINKANMDAYSDPSALREGWELIHLGNGEVSDRNVAATNAEALVVDAITDVSAELIAAMPNLKIIHSQGVAFNRINCAAAAERGIYVCNNAGVNAVPVAEHTVMLILSLLRSTAESMEAVFAGKQIEYKNKCFSAALPELMGKKVGIIGFGAIGRELAKRLAVFGCEIYYNDIAEIPNDFGAKYMEKDELLHRCDIVSLHAPVIPSTVHMMNKDTLALMKPGALLINTARGELVEQNALCAALESGCLGGFAADTLDPEPVTLDNPLLSLSDAAKRRVILTPHIAGLTEGSFRRTYRNIWSNIAAVEDGSRPTFVVNGI